MKTYTVEVEENGNKFWYLNGLLHREDAPAMEFASGTKKWYLNGKLHREDGPAMEFANGSKYWYLDGKMLLEQEFLNKTKTKPKTIVIAGITYNLIKVG